MEISFGYNLNFKPFVGAPMSEHCIEQTNTDNLSPLKQIRAGLGIGQIECKANFELLIGENGIFFCVTPQTKEILIKRGW